VQIRGDCCRLAHAPPGEEVFEIVREVVSPVPVGGRVRGHGAVRRVDVECHRGELKDGEVCAVCEHLLNAVPSADGKSLRVRCMFLESDDITTQMTLARDLATIEDTATLAKAAVELQERRVKQLLVTSGGYVVGAVSVADLRAGKERDRVASRTRPLTVVPRTLTIGAAARAMRAHQHDYLAVIDGTELLGLVTRGDLRRAGVPEI
jgi:CBS domain containing-hemolysin-like protein